MSHPKGMETEVKVGIFVATGLVLLLASILILGSSENLMTRKARFVSHFPNVEGLVEGAKVVMGGVQVGTVEKIAFDYERNDIKVGFQVARDQSTWIRADSAVEIQTQGVLGDKFVSLSRGDMQQPPAQPGAEIPNHPSAGLSQFLTKGDQLMVSLQSIAGSVDRMLKTFETNRRSEIFFEGMARTAKNLSSASEHLNEEIAELHLKAASKNLNAILEKVNNGTGTLGALVNDPGLYDDVKALLGGANRNRVMRNLVRQTIRKNDEAESQPNK
jgi:phospholipid/cholesterol/gamma-HCH transport system substrate-binding protein